MRLRILVGFLLHILSRVVASVPLVGVCCARQVPPEAAFDPRPELCAACFHTVSVLHQHSRFLCVTDIGCHSTVTRVVGLGRVVDLMEEDCPEVSDDQLSALVEEHGEAAKVGLLVLLALLVLLMLLVLLGGCCAQGVYVV